METFIKKIALGAGKILRDGFKKEMTIKTKAAAWDIVTQFDFASEKFLIAEIHKKYPDHGIVAEESGYSEKKKDFWVIDPLDGTRAFARGVPRFCVSIAFVHNHNIVLGAIYAPMTDELFFAQKGKGSFMNDKKIKVSNVKSLDNCWGAANYGSLKTSKSDKNKISNIMYKYNIWELGSESAALAESYTAMGGSDFYVSFNLWPWDYSAASLVMSEAGAKVTDAQGKKYRWNSGSILAANPVLHKQVMKEFKL